MTISNLLSLTCRKNLSNTELQVAAQICSETLASGNVCADGITLGEDSVFLNGQVVDIMGNLTDEQIESSIQVGACVPILDKTEEIITTCADISDEELINMRLSVNPSGAPKRLRIIRKNITPTPPPPEEPPADKPVDVTLVRKSEQNQQTITIDSNEIRLKLENCVDGKDYFYTLSSTDGESHEIGLFLYDNDRLRIIGDNLKIVSDAGQDDSLAVFGNNNYINTNSGDDIIRVGYIIDSNAHRSADNGQHNNVYAGEGNDYILVNGFYTHVDGGEGIDTIRYNGKTYSKDINNNVIADSISLYDINYMESTGGCTKSGIERSFDFFSISESNFNNKIEGGTQNGYGDCKLLSFINSLSAAGKLNEYINISKSGNVYTVHFEKTGRSVALTITDLEDDLDGARGDIDFVLIEAAFRSIIAEEGYILEETNGDSEHDVYALGNAHNNWLISKYICNMEPLSDMGDIAGFLISNYDNSFENNLRILMQAYLDGEISNMVVGTGGQNFPINKNIGIAHSHAYAVKGGVVGDYVLLTNPWDGNDIIKLDWADFLLYSRQVLLFGDAYAYAYRSQRDGNGIQDLCCNFEYTDGEGNKMWKSWHFDEPLTSGVEKYENKTFDFFEHENDIYDEIEDISSSVNDLKKILYEDNKLDLSF